jgi:hypothetical protein
MNPIKGGDGSAMEGVVEAMKLVSWKSISAFPMVTQSAPSAKWRAVTLRQLHHRGP